MIANMEVKSTLSRAGRFAVLSCGLVALTLLPVWAEEKPVQTKEAVQEERPNESQDLRELRVETDGEQAETLVSMIKISCKIIDLDWTKIRTLGIDVPFELQRLIPYLAKNKKLDSLVKNRVAKVLFVPPLTTISGRTASIKRDDLQMEALPQLQKDGTIQLQISIEWDPSSKDKRLYQSSSKTLISLRSGQTILIGGMRVSETSEKSGKRESDTLVLVTAEIVDSKAGLGLLVTPKFTRSQGEDITSRVHRARLHQKRSQLTKLRKEINDLLEAQTQTKNEHQEETGPLVTLSCKIVELDLTKLRDLGINLRGDVLVAEKEKPVIDLLKSLLQLGIAKAVQAPQLTTFPGRVASIQTDNMKLEVLPLLQKNGKIQLEVHSEWTSPGEDGSDTDPQSIDKVSELRDGQTLTLRGPQLTPAAENGDARDFETLVLVTVGLLDEPIDYVSSPVPKLGAKPLVVGLDPNGDPVIDREVPASNKRTELQRVRR